MIIDKKELFEIVDLDEPDYETDISINMPPKKVPDETKTAKKPKNKNALF